MGFDTSCYTTSAAIVDASGEILAAERRPLVVPKGGRGLRQQEMVFQHVAALPDLCERALAALPKGARIAAVAASTRPRAVEGSYMPAFTVGEGFARVIAASVGAERIDTDHQAGHIAAGRVDSGIDTDAHLVLHLSGGTTELLDCRGYCASILADTSDISAGQLVDRIGVALGLPFPAGPSLEACAREAQARGIEPPTHLGVSLKGNACSLSGAEAQAMRDIQAGQSAGEVALSVYSLLARLTARLLAFGLDRTGCERALLVGGVASSALFRELLSARLRRDRIPVQPHFARPALSGDNAVGVALIAREMTIGS